ncbi:hypothetical protein [Nocardia jinanensis]|uniref:Mce-associated membrane protein n=1 Tax=Nocardia jinanensis TaxID=382504 RepID=A0A917RUY0_9NOCA|nr:hypothetical protein [Nocardia jinanensis]GGL36840.1 hypothetical protein GCM10011588_59450 [Nocardia jinanensis]
MSDDKSVEAGTGEAEETVNPAAGAADEKIAAADSEAVAGESKSAAAESSSAARDSGPTESVKPGGDRPDGDVVRSVKPGGDPARAGSEGPRSTSRPARPLIAALVAAAVLLLGAVGVAGYLFVQERDKSATLAAYEEARQAACRYAPVLANYDAKNLDPYFSAVTAGATGDWKREFETTTAELREALVAGQVVSAAGDIQCAVKSADETSAETVVVIGQTISSLGTRGQPAPGQLSMVMRMQKIDGNWLVDQMITPLAPSPAP